VSVIAFGEIEFENGDFRQLGGIFIHGANFEEIHQTCHRSWGPLPSPQDNKKSRILAPLDKIKQKRTLHPHRL